MLPESESLREVLDMLYDLPPATYTDAQWRVIAAIGNLLKHATATLRLVFAVHAQVDFTEVAQAALHALGEDDAPTDLALALDYRVQHLLVDEFQDTSITQYELIAKLTAGWQPGDGRTLFAVGDPMQSIYRFREAEVGEFLTDLDEQAARRRRARTAAPVRELPFASRHRRLDQRRLRADDAGARRRRGGGGAVRAVGGSAPAAARRRGGGASVLRRRRRG